MRHEYETEVVAYHGTAWEHMLARGFITRVVHDTPLGRIAEMIRCKNHGSPYRCDAR